MTASRGPFHQIADRVTEAGLSGVLFAPEVPVAVGLTQGCSLIGAARTITEAADGVIAAIDGRPALEVFKEDIGELLAHNLRRVGGYIFAAFPISDSDTGDYLVRNLTGIDPGAGPDLGRRAGRGGPPHSVLPPRPRRRADRPPAYGADVKARAGAAPKAALYFSCIARGPSLFGDESEELRLTRSGAGRDPA